MEKILILDVDGVILDHPRGMSAWATQKGIPVGCKPEELYCYSMSPMFPHLSEKEIWTLLEEYSNHDDFANIPEIEGFASVLSNLRDMVPDLKVISITAPGASEKTVAARVLNLKKFLFDDVIVLPLGSSKLSELKKVPSGATFIDDVIGHVHAAETVGHRGILFRQPHNASTDHTRVLQKWDGAEDFVYDLLTTRTPQVSVSGSNFM
jgi:FMN phosphatase YigB (HAD superfamily)